MVIIGALSLLALSACNSSSEKAQHSQAIDGYIVGGSVYCDSEAFGVTGAAGQLSCPASTRIVAVRGGMDVGFDISLTSSDVPFVGEVRAPANLGYVTPLSTLAVLLSSNNGNYDASRWKASTALLARVLGEPSLDLTADAAQNMSLIRLNAQIHQVLAVFAKSEADYEQAGIAMTRVMAGRDAIGGVVDLADGVSGTMTAINAALLDNFSPLALPDSELEVVALSVQSANSEIAAASSPALVAATTADTSLGRAVATIDRNGKTVLLATDSRSQLPRLSINEFEDDTQVDGLYLTQVSSELNEVVYDNDMLEFDRNLADVQVTMAFELRSTLAGDTRSMSFVSDDIYLTASANQSGSLVITLPEDATFEAVGVNSNGTVTTAEILVDDEDTFSSDDGSFSVNFAQINSELLNLGFDDILVNQGNYSLTLIISGIQLNERSGVQILPATRHLVNVGDRQVSGAGFKGYVSYVN